jgi:phage FluMu protein Com
MAIEFHCDHCGKHIRTADEHAGKRGKCPHCQQSVYIPSPSEDLEPLQLAPLDPEEERRKQQLADETRRVVERIRAERDAPPERHKQQPHAMPAPTGDARLSADMERLLIDYAVKMAAGKLPEAQEVAKEIRGNHELANEAIQRLMADEMPPQQLAKIPRPVLIKFFKQLHEGA